MRAMSARVFIASLILAFAQTAIADSEDWTAGKTSFQNGDYQTALLHFESARIRGLDSPAVHYNIAVCHFKLGQFGPARETFELIARRFPRMQGLAEYNLGLVARNEGEMASATRHFLRAYELSPNNEKLRVLASNRLKELEPETSPASSWTGAVGIRVGFDDNVVLRDETGLPAGTDTESPSAELYTSIQGPSNWLDALQLEASLYMIRYVDADEYDQSEILGGAFYEIRRGDWRLDVGVHISAGFLGGDAFDRNIGASVRANRPVGNDASLGLSYLYDDISDANTLFAGVSGSKQKLQARYRKQKDRHRWSFSYSLELNNREDPGVSPRRNEIGAKYRYQTPGRWGYESGVAFRSSDYDDLGVPRTEDLLTLQLALTKPLNDAWLAVLDYRYSDNDSSDPEFSYDRQQVSLGVMRLF